MKLDGYLRRDLFVCFPHPPLLCFLRRESTKMYSYFFWNITSLGVENWDCSYGGQKL